MVSFAKLLLDHSLTSHTGEYSETIVVSSEIRALPIELSRVEMSEEFLGGFVRNV